MTKMCLPVSWDFLEQCSQFGVEVLPATTRDLMCISQLELNWETIASASEPQLFIILEEWVITGNLLFVFSVIFMNNDENKKLWTKITLMFMYVNIITA